MPRAGSNPSSRIWGIRVTAVDEVRSEALKGIKGIIVVVHEVGLESTKPHYHIYYDHGFEARKSDITDHLKRTWLTIFNGLDGRKNVYSFDTGKDWSVETYWKYVWAGKPYNRKVSLLCWNLDTPQLPIPEVITHEFPDLVVVGDEVAPVVKKSGNSTSEEKMLKFCRYVEEQFNIGTNVLTDEFIADCLIEYSKGGFNENTAPQYIRRAMYYVLDKAGESKIDYFRQKKREWRDRVLRKFFS